MKIIVGLGNPGEKYINNRHNVGFMFVDYITSLADSSRRSASWRIARTIKNSLYSSSEMKWSREDIVLAKPQTFMNKSGLAVKKLIENLPAGRQVENLIIVHDDLDIPLGKFRIDLARGPRLHNGLTSIEQTLKTQDFWRIRIGVDNRQGLVGNAERRIVPGEDYVLQDFKQEEREIINNLFPKIFERLKNLSSNDK